MSGDSGTLTTLVRWGAFIHGLVSCILFGTSFNCDPDLVLMFINILCVACSFCWIYYITSGGGTIETAYIFVVILILNLWAVINLWRTRKFRLKNGIPLTTEEEEEGETKGSELEIIKIV